MQFINSSFNDCVQSAGQGKRITLTLLCSAEIKMKFNITRPQRGMDKANQIIHVHGFCETINRSIRHNLLSNDISVQVLLKSLLHLLQYDCFILQRRIIFSVVIFLESLLNLSSTCPKLTSFWNKVFFIFCQMGSIRLQIQFFMYMLQIQLKCFFILTFKLSHFGVDV